MDAIDRHPMTAQLDCQRLCHVHQAGIADAAAEIAGVAGVATADVDDTTPARRLHERDDSAGTAQRSDILHVEVLQQILVDDGFDRAGRGGRAAWCGPAVHQDVQAAQLLCRLGTMRSTCSLLVTSAARGMMRRFVSAANSRAVASRSALFRATIATSAPSRANCRAMALPMPRLRLVTIACLSCNPRSVAFSPALEGRESHVPRPLFSPREPGARRRA